MQLVNCMAFFIFHPAVRGWWRGEEGQNNLDTYFRGVKKLYNSFEGVKNPYLPD